MKRNFNLIKEIGKELRRIREKKNTPMQEIAEKSGVSTMYISEIERDKKVPSDDLIRKLADSYDVNVLDLYEGFRKVPDAVIEEILNNSDLFEVLYAVTHDKNMTFEDKTKFYSKIKDEYGKIGS